METLLRKLIPENWSLQVVIGWVFTLLGAGNMVFNIGFEVEAIKAALDQFISAGGALWLLIYGPLIIWFRVIVTSPLVSTLMGMFLKKS